MISWQNTLASTDLVELLIKPWKTQTNKKEGIASGQVQSGYFTTTPESIFPIYVLTPLFSYVRFLVKCSVSPLKDDLLKCCCIHIRVPGFYPREEIMLSP